jgi:hypothetical protein
MDLFRETDTFTDEQRDKWVSYLRSFQDKERGYFEPETYLHEDRERNRYQLTCFCLSALGILGARPEFPLSFVEQWRTPDDVTEYLHHRGCHEGRPGSGNKAMFLAIFFTCEYERTRDTNLLDKIEAWFDFHNQRQNRSGFWGSDLRSHYLHGLQNGFHQFVIYQYWRKEIPRLRAMVDVALTAQDRKGFFAPTPGGEACHDYDTIHVLATAHRMADYRRRAIASCLRRAFDALLTTQNDDGGFCQSRCRLATMADFLKNIPTCLSGKSPPVWYFRAKASLAAAVKKRELIHTGWTDRPRSWGESNLWDTWFRCLALAEIAHTIDDSAVLDFRDVRFHKSPGLGWFPG